MNIFESNDLIKTYDPKWTVKFEEMFSQDTIDAVEKAEIKVSDYGLSVCFHLRNFGGKISYIPVDENTECHEGDILDLHEWGYRILSKEGRKDIVRAFKK